MPVRAFCAMPPGYITYATAGAIRDKIRNGEPFDSPQESVVGPTLPNCAVHKVVSYLRYWRRPKMTPGLSCIRHFRGNDRGMGRLDSHPFRRSGQNSANEGCSPIVLSIA
jgi:hypothetical protein